MHDEPIQLDERRLWQAYAANLAAGGAAAARCPDELTLAAYLDGRLDQAARDAVEAHLASCAACLNAATQTRAIITEVGGGSMAIEDAPSKSFLVAAQALVRDRNVALAQPRSWEARAAETLPWRWRWTRWTVGAAAAVAVSFAAFHFGSSVNAASVTMSDDELTRQMTFGLVSGDGGGEFDAATSLLAMTVNGEATQ